MASDKPTYPSDAADKFIVRFPPGMRERIAESAKANNRSMNAEVIDRLQRTLGQVEPEFRDIEDRFAEALLEQRLESLRMQWRSERLRTETLRDRVNRLRHQGAPKEEIDGAERELFVSEVELDDLEKIGKSLAGELKGLGRTPVTGNPAHHPDLPPDET